ncbi:MAG: hypothetical protein MPK62_02200 [Alphaproteobacteria bacterium]|nr:hypothetical protein [Alphaproteobacteria bacterium]MDA8029946.1 hypothetical protein [Alphaproteobacteria bacterium]
MPLRTVKRSGLHVDHDEYKRMKTAAGITYSVGPNVTTMNDLADAMIIEMLVEIFPGLATAKFIHDTHEKALVVIAYLPEPVQSSYRDVLKDLGLEVIKPRMLGRKPKRGEISIPSVVRGNGNMLAMRLGKRYLA